LGGDPVAGANGLLQKPQQPTQVPWIRGPAAGVVHPESSHRFGKKNRLHFRRVGVDPGDIPGTAEVLRERTWLQKRGAKNRPGQRTQNTRIVVPELEIRQPRGRDRLVGLSMQGSGFAKDRPSPQMFQVGWSKLGGRKDEVGRAVSRQNQRLP